MKRRVHRIEQHVPLSDGFETRQLRALLGFPRVELLQDFYLFLFILDLFNNLLALYLVLRLKHLELLFVSLNADSVHFLGEFKLNGEDLVR